MNKQITQSHKNLVHRKTDFRLASIATKQLL